MKVALIVASRARSLVNFRGALIDAMLAGGWSVEVVCPKHDGNDPAITSLTSKGVDVHLLEMERTGTSVLNDLLLLMQLTSLFRRIRPNVLLAYTIKPVVYGIIAAWIAQVPNRFAIITGLGYAFGRTGGGRIRKIVEALYAFALTRASTVFFQNPDDLALFRERKLLPPESKVVVVNGSGVDLDYFPFHERTESPFPRFLFIGRLLVAKGIREYAEAARLVRREHPHARFSIAGWIDKNPDSIHQDELSEWVASGLDYLGKLDDVRPALSESDVFVLPSYREGTPRTVLEAMATGRAIITTDAPGCRETVMNGENGFLVPVKSIDALAQAMRRFIDSPRLIESMGRRSREIAEEKYDVHKVNAVMLDAMGIAGP